MKKVLLTLLYGISSYGLIGCVGNNETNSNNAQLLQANIATSASVKMEVPGKTLNELESDAVREGVLTTKHVSNEDFDISLPRQVIMTYTTGAKAGLPVWFKQYHAGVLNVDQYKKLCGLHFNSVYNKQYDVIFGEGNCNNNDGEECQIPYYVAAHGDIKKDTYDAFIHYHYSVALDGKDCNNGISPAIVGVENITISKQDDNNYHSVFAVDTDKNVMPPIADRDGIPSLFLDQKGGESVMVYSTGQKSINSILIDEKMTHDYASRSMSSFGYLDCEPNKFKKDDQSYSMSPEMDKRCEVISGEGAKNIGIMFTNQFLGSKMAVDTVMEDKFKSSVHLLYPEQHRVNLLPGQSQRVDLCLSKEQFSGLIKHNYDGIHPAKGAVGEGFFTKEAFVKFFISRNIQDKSYTEKLTLSRHGHVYENGKEVFAMNGYEGYCAAKWSVPGQSVNPALEDLETKFFLNIDTDINVSSSIPREYAQANAMNFTRPIRIENIGMQKSIDQDIYATNVEYYLVDKDSMKKIQPESWGLFNSIVKNEKGENVPLQFNSLSVVDKWEAGVSSMINFFANCKTDSCYDTPKNSGFLVIKFRDVDGRALSQVFPFIIAYDDVYLTNSYDYNIFTGMPIIRDKSGNVTKQDSGAISLSTFKRDIGGGYWQYPNLQTNLNDGRKYKMDAFNSGQKQNFATSLELLGFNGTKDWELSFEENLKFLPTALLSWKLNGWEQYVEHLYAGGNGAGEYNILPYFEIPVVNLENGSEWRAADVVSTMRPTSKIIAKSPHIRVEATVTAQAADIFQRSGIKYYTRLLSETKGFTRSYYFDNDTKGGIVIGDFEYAKRDVSGDYSLLDDFRDKVQFPVQVELVSKAVGNTVGQLFCSLANKTCNWNGRAPAESIIRTTYGDISINYKLDKGSDGFSVLHVVYDTPVVPEYDKFTYIIDNMTYHQMSYMEEDLFTLYFPKAYSAGFAFGSDPIGFNAKDEVNGSMKKDLTENIFSVINKHRTQVCDWNGTRATLSCKIAIAPDYFEGQNKHLKEAISNNVSMTLNFIIPSPNGEWQTKVLSPKNVTFIDVNSELTPNQAVIGGTNSKFNGVFVREYNRRIR